MRHPSRSLVSVPLLAAAIVSFAAACGPSAAPPAAPIALAVAAVAPAPSASVALDPVRSCVDDGTPLPGLDGSADQDLRGKPSVKGAAAEKACAKIARRAAKAESEGPGAKHGALADVGACYSAGEGAWALDPGAASIVDPDEQAAGNGGWEVPYSLTYVTPRGALVGGGPITGTVAVRERESRDVRIFAVFDFDGDGVSEIIVAEDADYGGEEHDSKISVVTFRDGEVKSYAPAEKLDIQGIVDIDLDGRPDLLVPGPFLAQGPCGYDGQDFQAPAHLAHSVAGGGFSLDDAVAQAVIRDSCGPLATELVAVEHGRNGTWIDPMETARRISCARIYGVSAEAAARRIRARYPFPDGPKAELPLDASAPGYCMPLRSMLELAGQTPLFTTAPPCLAN